MHPVMTMKNWSRHLHDGTLMLWRQVNDHLHSRHFWVGVGMTLLLLGILALLFSLARNTPYLYPRNYPYTPYGV